MSIKKIKESTVTNIPVVEGVITNIGPVKNSKAGDYRVVTLKDEEAEIKIKFTKNYINGLDDDLNKAIRILGGRPKGGKSVGIRVDSNDKIGRFLVVEDGAVYINDLNGSAEKVVKEKAKLNKEEPPKNEKIKEDKPTGPLDKEITLIAKERFYIHHVISSLSEGYPLFPKDKLPELATSIHIELSRKYNNQSPLPRYQRKERFVEEKKEDPKDEEEKVTEPKGDVNLLISFLDKENEEPWYHTKTSKGENIGDVFRDDKRRCVIAHWYYSSHMHSLSPEAKNVRESVSSFIKRSKYDMIEEALYFDCVALLNEDFKFEDCFEVANEAAKYYCKKRQDNSLTREEIALGWFLIKKENRIRAWENIRQ